MPNLESWYDEPDDELADDEFPDEDDFEDDDLDEEDSLTIVCRECGSEIYEDAVQCPVCGNYVVHDTSAWTGRPLWWLLLGLLGVVATILTLAGL